MCASVCEGNNPSVSLSLSLQDWVNRWCELLTPALWIISTVNYSAVAFYEWLQIPHMPPISWQHEVIFIATGLRWGKSVYARCQKIQPPERRSLETLSGEKQKRKHRLSPGTKWATEQMGCMVKLSLPSRSLQPIPWGQSLHTQCVCVQKYMQRKTNRPFKRPKRKKRVLAFHFHDTLDWWNCDWCWSHDRGG